MIDYSKWKSKKVKLANLLLDEENPRIPPTTTTLDQDSLIGELIEHEDVLDLAKRISSNGFYTDELPIVFPKDRKLVVVEGNRRVAALKALAKPNSVPSKYKQRFSALAKQATGKPIDTIGVLVAPTRSAALPRIADKHTRNSVESWKPAQQARFYRTMLDGGKSALEICQEFRLTESQLAEFLRLDAAYRMACGLDLAEGARTKVHDSRTFPVTTLLRVLESEPGKAFLGIRSDPRELYKGSVTKESFSRALARIVNDIATEQVTSRSLNDANSIKRYLETLGELRPDASKRGSFKASDFFQPPPAKQEPAAESKSTTGVKSVSTKLIPNSFHCTTKNQRVIEVFGELRRLNYVTFPNAAGILLRVLLELSVSDYIAATGKTRELLKKFEKQQKPKDWHPSLRQQLVFVDESIGFDIEPLELKSFRKFLADKSGPVTLDALDGFVHNKQVHPVPREISATWICLEPVFRFFFATQGVSIGKA